MKRTHDRTGPSTGRTARVARLALVCAFALPAAGQEKAAPSPILPTSIELGGIPLEVESYDAYSLDASGKLVTGARGTAWANPGCVTLGSSSVAPPAEGPKPEALRVAFDELSFTTPPPGQTAVAGAGSASYPIDPADAGFAIELAGHAATLDALTVLAHQVTADLTLPLHESIVDPATCRPAEVTLTGVTWDGGCELREVRLGQSWGPWVLTESGMTLEGTGLVVDLDPSWSWSGWTGGSMSDAWTGVVLPSGDSVSLPSGTVTSNLGYLKAPYRLLMARVDGAGLEGTAYLSSAYDFRTLLPHGFDVHLPNGNLTLAQSRVTGGSFPSANVTFPSNAVRVVDDVRVKAYTSGLEVQGDLDLFADLSVTSGLWWGEFVEAKDDLPTFGMDSPTAGAFRVSGAYEPVELPVGPAGFEDDPPTAPYDSSMESAGLQGAFLTLFDEARVQTPDKPWPSDPIEFTDDRQSWVHVGGHGVNASLHLVDTVSTDLMFLGPEYRPDFASPHGFLTDFAPAEGDRNAVELRFLDSAVHTCEAAGEISLPSPAAAALPFSDLAFTSTAQIPGARVELEAPVQLGYWNLGLIQDPLAQEAGVVSVRSGQLLLTGAGITEERHFSEPFWAVWGEMLADGTFGRFLLDRGRAGQTFDGFPFTPEAMGLSPFDVAISDPAHSFFQVGGTVHLDFFGAHYVNLKDRNHPADLTPPFDGRRVELAHDSAFGTRPSDTQLARDWGNGFGDVDFVLDYNEVGQDGFLGVGQMGFAYVDDGSLDAIADIDSDGICLRIDETATHDFTAGPVAHFGAMGAIRGCACIVDGQMERVLLSAELEATGNANVVLRSGAHAKLEYYLTPSVSDLRVAGNFYAGIVVGGDLEVDGAARFVIDRDALSIAGEVDARIDGNSLLAGIDADGQLEWYLSAPVSGDSYQSIQGRLTVAVMGALGGVSREGGFYAGIGAPKSKAWVLLDKDDRYGLEMGAMPDELTGVYGYARAQDSVNLWVLQGGYEVFVGLGGFLNVGTIPAIPTGTGPEFLVAVPYVVGNLGARLWGEIAGGLVGGSAFGNIQLMGPYPFGFHGTVGLEGCVLWALCTSVDVTVGLNTADGFYLN